jgi:hypothetical protein
MADNTITEFKSGVHNLKHKEVIPPDAASDSQNWYTQDGRIKLVSGRLLVGDEGAVGAVYGEIWGYKVDGSGVHWRKVDTKIQYFDGTDWQDVVTGLTSGAEYTFSNYSSLAGTFTFAFGVDGIFKFHNANPTSYISLYSSTKNFKGFGLIDRGRTILWGRKEDRTGLYGSKIDPQGSNYTTTTAENRHTGDGSTLTFAGTLAFKAGGATRNCFAVNIYCSDASGESFVDNYNGTLTGSYGGTGTINYISGAYSVTFAVGHAPAATANNVKATYQYEDSNTNGITDFTKSAPRQAGEGFVFPQDIGGDAIMTVLVGQDGAYYSLKKNSAYKLTISDDDTDANNEVYRTQIGVPTLRGGVVSSKGIVFLNTANPTRPELTILQKNVTGDNVEPIPMFPHFSFGAYDYTDCSLGIFEQYILVACRSAGSAYNNVILLCNMVTGTVDITTYSARTFAQNTYMYIGSAITQSVYQLFTGFDDDGYSIDNYYITREELYGTNKRKRFRKLRFMGNIDPDQKIEVYLAIDGADFSLVGTIVGSGSYVDDSASTAIGGEAIGADPIGGSTPANAYPFYVELKPKVLRFRSRRIKLVATGIGYVDINTITDHDVSLFDEKVPSRFRTKQNVSLDGLSTDEDNPSY